MAFKGIITKVTQTLNKFLAPSYAEGSPYSLDNNYIKSSVPPPQNINSLIYSSAKPDFKEFPKLPLLDVQFVNSNIKANNLLPPKATLQDMFLVDEEKWQGGKPVGNIQLMGNIYYIRHSEDIIKKISILDFESPDKAFNEAKKFLYDYSKQHELLRNEYRFVEDSNGKFLEVKAGSGTFFCDIEHQKIIQEYIWNMKHDGTVYAKHSGLSDKSEVLFHKFAAGHLDSHIKVKHLDGNKRNNRSYNLSVRYPTSFNVKTGKSMPHVYKSGNYWYYDSGKKTRKFSIIKYGDEEAFRLAMKEGKSDNS